MFVVGIIIGWGAFRFMYPVFAPTSPIISLGNNTGRIVTFDVEGWGTPNFFFQQEGRLPVVLYPAAGTMTLTTVALLDGRIMTYQTFVEDFKSTGGEAHAHSLFTVDYQENDIDELGYVLSIKEVQR